MPDPYGITQVDIPGVYGAVQNARMGRIQQMLGQLQVGAAERQAERENRLNIAVTSLFGGQGAGSGAGASAGATPPPNPVVAAYGGVPPGPGSPAVTPPGLPGANPAGTAAMGSAQPAGVRQLDPAAVQHIIAADPVHGPALVQSLYQMSNEQLTAAQRRMQALAPLYARVAQIPYGTDGAARRAYIQSIAPTLAQMNIDPQMATSWDPTDANLNAHMALGQTYAEAIEAIQGHLQTLVPGAVVSRLDPFTMQSTTVAQSPLVPGPLGATYPRPESMDQTLPHPRTPQEAAALPPGTRFVDPNGVPRTVPGGPPPANAAGTFPRQDGGAFDFNLHPAGR